MFNFPDAPLVGDTFSAGAGLPIYMWDGEKWANKSSAYAGAVLFDQAQSLIDAQSLQARQNIYAAPFNAMMFTGLQVNGAMEVAQELGANNVFAQNNNRYVCDVYQVGATHATGRLSCLQQPLAGSLPGLNNYLRMVSDIIFGSYAASDVAILNHSIEGNRWSRLKWGSARAFPVTVSFWIYAAIPGTATLSIRNPPANNRSYVANFTVNIANTWEYKTVTIPGDVAGTWLTTNAAGATISWCFGAGTGFQWTGASGIWFATNGVATPQTTNFFGTVNNYVHITGVLILPGSAAPPQAQHSLLMRPYQYELPLVQRYWESTYPIGTPPGSLTNTGMAYLGLQTAVAGLFAGGTGTCISDYQCKVTKRVIPTVTPYSPQSGSNGAAWDYQYGGGVACNVTPISENNFRWYAAPVATTSVYSIGVHFVMDARM